MPNISTSQTNSKTRTSNEPASREMVDVLVCGGGIAGMIAAAAFGASGFRTVMVDPSQPITQASLQGADQRSTAFLRPARDLFKKIGIWDALEPKAMPLDGLRIVDTALDETSQKPQVRAQRQFEGRETADEPFGWNFLNWHIRDELMQIVPSIENTDMRFGVGFKSMITRTDHAVVTLTDGSRIQAKLVVAADGRNSAVRDAAGIGVSTTRYGQKSLAFTALHSEPHGNISTEIYREGGPFTMVPLADIDGRPASAVVWMNPGPRATQLLHMAPEEFNAEMTHRSAGLYGPLELASNRGVFPIITQVAKSLTAQRTALIAEAAHVLPPIGAQGLNTSLNDLAALVECCTASPATLGDAAMLETYAKLRKQDITVRAKAIDAFNRVVQSENALLQSVRMMGLKAAHDITPVRRGLMRAGLAPISSRAN